MLQFKSNIPLKFEQIQKLERRSRDVQRADVRSKDVGSIQKLYSFNQRILLYIFLKKRNFFYCI